jgi:hypothetical protein
MGRPASWILNTLKSSPLASWLRQELGEGNRAYAARHELTLRESFGAQAVICNPPAEDGQSHGNFLTESYRHILERADWCRRLGKVHAQAQYWLPREGRGWRELDSANSSDALLMNIFCFPGTLRQSRVFDLLGIENGSLPEFGVRGRVPLANGRFDRTEIEMRIGGLLMEAKLTEADFQSSDAAVLDSYRNFAEVFERQSLRQSGSRYISYQLIRNVLAAFASQYSFCVMADARRPDLREAWYQVMRCVRILGLRLRCKMITWQEVAETLPARLQTFLDEKYGISPGNGEGVCDAGAGSDDFRPWI